MRRRALARIAAVVAVVTLLPLLAASPASATSYGVTLTASARDVPPGAAVMLVASANADVATSPWLYLQIWDVTAGRLVAICGEGTTCVGHAAQFGETARTYVAVIAEYAGQYPPPGVVATSTAVGVRWSATVGTSAVTGVVGFTATARLPRFPCPPPPPYGTGPCAGTLEGTSHGHLTGSNGLDVFDVSWEGASGGTLAATFGYSEWACDGTENVVGSAFGTGRGAASRPSVAGYYKVADEPFARSVLGVSARFEFDWVRVGATAAMSFESFDLSVTVDGLGERRVLTGSRLGAASFAVTGTEASGAPTCDSPLTNVEGEVAGTIRVT